MSKKIIFGLLTALLALSLIGCGGNDDSAKTVEPAPTVPKPEYSADKAILAYAQLYAYGLVEDDIKAVTGLTDEEIEAAQNEFFEPITESFREYPLSEENVEKMVGQYVKKLRLNMDIKTEISKDDLKSPIVELTATTIKAEDLDAVVEKNTDMVALGEAMSELQKQGMTEEQLKANTEFQKFVLESISRFIDEFPLNREATIKVPCKMIQGSDGKMYWAPVDADKVKNFVAGD